MENSTQHSPTDGMRVPAAKKGAYYTLMLTLLLLGSIRMNAQQYATVTVTGFNADVIANGATEASSTTADADGTGYYFYNTNYAFYTTGNSMPTSGTFNSTATTGLTFQLADASANNSLRLLNAGPASGALVFTTPRTAGVVYVLNTSGSGASTVNMTVKFTDSTSQSFPGLSISDWFNPAGTGSVIATGGVGRAGTTGAPENTTGTTPHFFQTALNILPANLNKLIAYVSFTQTAAAGPIAHIVAISVQSACAAPVDQATALTFSGITTSTISGSFTAAASSPSGYLVVRYPNSATPTTPVAGTSYTAGTAFGAGKIESVGTATTFNSVGLSGATTYTYYVYDYNNTACAGGPLYDTIAPLTLSQATLACSGTLSGTVPVGPTAPASPAGFATLTAAATYIGSNGLGGKTTLELQSDYTSVSETFPITFSTNACISAAKSLTIRPAAGATGLSIVSGAAETIDLNGAQYITIDGRPGGVGTTSQLSIIDTATGTTGVAVRFINDASNNKITYCDIQGRNTSATSTALSGVVYFGAASTNTAGGNDNDTLSYCNIHGTTGTATPGYPTMGIVSSGTTTSVATYNDNGVITNCNIYDIFSATAATTAVKLDVGNNAWTVTNNSVYQTASHPYVYTTGNTHRAFWITPNASTTTASGFTITGNYIGGTAALAGGTVYSMSGSGAVSSSFSAMDVSVGTAATTSVQNNVITNISFSTSSTSATALVGINLANGNVDCGSTTANTIGSATATGAIQFTTSGNSGGVMGIHTAGGNNYNINNNTIAGITVNGSSATVYSQFAGINVAGGTTITINNNTIGSLTVANSINIATAATGTSTTAYTMQGIWVSSATTTSITGNVIANLNTNYGVTSSASSSLRGIFVATGTTTIAGNTIRNLSSASNTTANGFNCAIVGIAVTSPTAGSHLITGNTIRSLNLTGTATSGIVGITGIFTSTSSTASTVSNNFLNTFTIAAVNNAAVITGFDIGGGRVTYANNMVRLGVDTLGADITAGVQFRGFTKGAGSANYYYNSVYVGGNNVVGTQTSFAFGRGTAPGSGTPDSVVNNIFVDNRSNGSGATATVKHYALSLTGGTGFLVLNNNVYYANGTGGVFAVSTATDVPAYTASWIAGDSNSVYGDPHFIAATGAASAVNLHISTSGTSIANNAGRPIGAVTTDFDGDTRSATTPDIGADEFVGSTLPVTLVSFQGQKQGSSNLLTWTTATEINSSDFELQRGIDGSTFATLAIVASKAVNGNSSTLLTYQSTDAKPLATDNYYRLKLVDKDGSYAYSNIVLLKGDETMGTTVVAIYPNPVADHLNIVINAKGNGKVSLLVSDMNGKQISSQNVQLVPGANSMQVNVSHLAQGTYAVKIVTADGKVVNTSLFVK